MRRKRNVTEEERRLWSTFVRDVTPLDHAPGQTPLMPAASQNQTDVAALRHNAEYVPAATLRPASGSPVASLTGSVAGSVAASLTGSLPGNAPFRPLSRSSALMTPGELAVAVHLRGKAGKKKHPSTTVRIGAPHTGLDTGSWKRLSRGHTPVERKLDLHGMTAQAAFLRLHDFLYLAHAEGVRCVEIVTGLGTGPEGGVLRRELPFWLSRDDLRRMVLAATYSHDANRGAVRILLKKRRQSG